MSFEGQDHFLTLVQGCVHTKIKLDFLRNYCADLNQSLFESFQVQGTENLIHDAGDAGHMTKMATTPIYGKNLSKVFLSGTGGPISTKLGMYNFGLQPIIVCSNDDPGVTLTFFTARSNLVTYVYQWEKVKRVDFSETIAASDLKVGRCRQLIESMKVFEY